MVAADLSLELSEVIAIGDSDLDIPMFKTCGYSVALANATPATKAAANHVTTRSMAEGLLEALNHVSTLQA